MKVQNITNNNEVECILTKNQILMIKNCLGEICFGMDLNEFQTRTGFSRDDVGELVKQLKKVTSELGIEE